MRFYNCLPNPHWAANFQVIAKDPCQSADAAEVETNGSD